ncbi:MAG: glycosyl hydrolase, partial [Chthonomonadales bacterium]
TQQGYSPFSTWTRGLAWAILGFAEQLEFLTTLDEDEFTLIGDKSDIISELLAAAIATADFYCEHSPTDGIPYWDTGAPGLAQLGEWRNRPAEPFNDHEPIDSSAAAIAAQGLIRMAQYLDKSDPAASNKYLQAGLTTTKTLLGPTYLSCDAKHEGLLLHTVYHRPNGWDYVPEGRTIPCGESCMWGDYHLQELGLLVQRLATEKKYPTFFGG